MYPILHRNDQYRKIVKPFFKFALGALVYFAFTFGSFADDCDVACQAARNAQNPLAPVRAIMTDNTFSFGPDSTRGYNFQVQPVYTIATDQGYNVILRGIIPINGVPASTGGHDWGIGDSFVQAFYVPETSGNLKYGFGPQLSLPTNSGATFVGPGWGVGAAAVVFGFAGDLSYGGIVGHHFAENDFSLTTFQPIVMYNLDLFGGSYIGYNNSILYNWKASSGDAWTVPLGATFGKTFVSKSGYATDVNIGAYKLAERPAGGPDWVAKFGLSVFFP